MSKVGSVVVISALLALLIGFGATVLNGILTGRLYYEPNHPPIVFRERPVKFFALLAFDLVVVVILGVGCVKIERLLFSSGLHHIVTSALCVILRYSEGSN